MDKLVRKQLLNREMSRKEFLQFMGGSLAVLFGLSNLLSLLTNVNKPAEPQPVATDTRHGFGSRKFGV